MFNPNRNAKIYWPVFILYKFIIALLLGLFESNKFGALFILALQLFFLVSVLLAPPYTSTPQNVRMIFNEFIASLVLVVFCVYRLELTESLTLLYVVGWLVLGSMLPAVGVFLHTIFKIS